MLTCDNFPLWLLWSVILISPPQACDITPHGNFHSAERADTMVYTGNLERSYLRQDRDIFVRIYVCICFSIVSYKLVDRAWSKPGWLVVTNFTWLGLVSEPLEWYPCCPFSTTKPTHLTYSLTLPAHLPFPLPPGPPFCSLHQSQSWFPATVGCSPPYYYNQHPAPSCLKQLQELIGI